MSNAVKYCDPSAGRVAVAAEARDDELVVCVSDNGPGVAPEDRDRIFERFQRAGDAVVGKPYGTGLGLAICREIIERFGGRIWLESEAGRGASFSFTVPRSAEAALSAPDAG